MSSCLGPTTRILVVDDNTAVREALCSRIALSSPCYAPVGAPSAGTALELLAEQPFDVVLADLVLKGERDGIALTREIAEHHPGVRVVVFSGYESGERKMQVLKAGAFAYLAKPINHDELLHAIETINSIRRTEWLGDCFQTLAQISFELQGSFDLDHLARRIVAGVGRLGYARGRLYLFDAERQILVGKASVGLPEGTRFEQFEIPVTAASMINAIFQANRPVVWNRPRLEERFGHEVTERWLPELGLEMLSWVDLPLVVGQERIGTLAVDQGARAEASLYTEEDLEILGVLAGLAAQALHNAQTYEKEALANASLRSILRDAPDAVLTTDLEGIVNFVSPSSERVLGLPAKRIIGQPAAGFYCDEDGTPGSGRAIAREIMARLRREGTISNLRLHFVTGSEGPRPISLSVSLLHDERGGEIGTLGIVKDLGPLEARSRQYRDLLEGFGYGTLLLTPKGIVRFANRKAERLLQQPVTDIEGRKLQSLVLATQRSELEARLREVVEQGAEVSLDLSLLRPGEQRLSVRARLSPVGGRQAVTGVAVALSDKGELGALIQSGRLMALGQMVAGVAHEVNNPLNNMVVAAREAERRLERGLEGGGELDAKVRDYLEIVERNGERIRTLVEQLREFARPGEFQRVRISANGVIRDSAAFFETRFRNRNIELVLDLDPELPEILGDAKRLQQVFVNLIVNAEDAMDGQDEPQRVTIRSRPGPPGRLPSQVRLEVEDTGPGIPEEIAQAIFDPFFTTKPPTQGTGLGLSISKSIVDMHGGALRVEPGLEGRGARFVLELDADIQGAEGHTAEGVG